ncbi:MAG: iron ABC transporter permease [Deltaproteobacteria bacterium]|nr:iron ABC transporter permease [Deltaproteobacteria bacterium]
MLSAKKIILTCSYLFFFLAICFLISIKSGAVSFSWGEVFDFSNKIITSIRIPRVILSLIVGASLSLAGVVFQAILKNPLADPYVLGVSSGGAVGSTLAVLLGLVFLQPLYAFFGSFLSIVFVLFVAKRTSSHSLILTGVILNFFLASLLTLFLSLASPAQLSSSYTWILGSLSFSSWDLLLKLLPFILISILFLYYCSHLLNILSLGEEKALTLGVSVQKWNLILLLITSFLTAIVVSLSGIIGFVGLIIPHTARNIWGSDHRILIPTSLLLGGSFVMIADTLARTLFLPAEIPVGVLTAIIGAPLFIYFLKKGYDFQSARN